MLRSTSTNIMGFNVPKTQRDDLSGRSDRSDISSISAISHKKSNHEEEIIDMNQQKNKRLVDKERLFLDVELNLRNEHENSFDEAQFNFAKNSQNYLRDAFLIEMDKKKIWRGKFKSMMKDEGIIKNENEFPKFLTENKLENFVNSSGYADSFKYSFNTYADNEENSSERSTDSVYFTKFLIAMNLIFRVSYVYRYSFDVGYKKYFNTIFKFMVLQLVEFDSEQNYLFTIPNETDQIIFFSTVFIWLLCFIYFYILVRQYSVKREIHLETFSIKYNYKPISVGKRFQFNLVLILFLYLYIPIVRDSMVTIFVIYDQSKANDASTTANIQSIFTTEGSTGLWIKFFLSVIVFLAFFYVPFFLFKLVKNNHPLLNPFDELNDTNFHSVDCPKTCSGALLDIEKRMCWDFTKDLYFVDLNRPISIMNYHNKLSNVLAKYYTDNFTIKSPIMMLFKGYTYECKYYLFWFLIKHYVFIFVVKIPFSSIFADAPENNMQKRSLASFSFSVLLCFYFVIDGIKNFEKKFAFKHDMVLSVIVDIFVFLLSFIGLLKVSIVGEYVFSYVQNQVDYNSILSAMEVLSFVILMFSVLTLCVFMIYSIPQIREKVQTKQLNVPWEWLDSDITEKEIKKAVIEFLWKPFWDSIFRTDQLCLANIDINDEKFIQHNLDGKRYDHFDLKDLAMNANSRVNAFKRRLVKSYYDEKNEVTDEENNINNNNLLQEKYEKEKKLFENVESDLSHFENLTKSDILLRKLIQFKLEGIDCYWDGDVIGKRTCHNYFGRLLVTEFPFSLVIIYDETNEKVEIPKTGWIHLCKLNLHNYEIIRQVSIREQLRLLHLKEVSYEENYFDKSVGKKKENKNNNEEMKKLMQEKKKAEINIKNIKKGLKFIKNLKTAKNKKIIEKNSKSKTDNEQKIGLPDPKAKKNKKVPNQPPRDIKKGILHVESIIPENPMTHGFRIYLKVYDPKNPKKLKETINFDALDICVNARNFRYCRLNILLTMNDHLIKEEDAILQKKKKEAYRKENCFKRYLNELTLSSLFCNMIYDNSEVTLMEIFKYFIKYEKRNSIKILPYIHLDGIIRALNLWQLLLTNPIQSFWYVFFHQLWTLNRVTFSDLKLSKYFNPNTSLSICYYIFEKEKFDAFISKLNIQGLIKKDVVNALDKRVQELKHEERDRMKNKLLKGHEDGIVNLAGKDIFETGKKEKALTKKKRNFNKEKNVSQISQIDSSEVRLNITDNKSGAGITNNDNPIDPIEIEDEKLDLLLSGYQPFLDKFIQIIPDYSPVQFCTPSWCYLTYNNEYLLVKMPEFVSEENRLIIAEYFKSNMKNPNKLFEELGEWALFVGVYSDSEIFELYESKDLNCEDPQLAKFALDKTNFLETSSLRSRVKQKGLTTLDWGSMELQLVLPPTLKFIDEKFSNPLDGNYAQKIDDKGRIFFVDNKHKKTSFLHPHMRKREKTRLEKELELTFGKLPDGWEIINYKTPNNEVRLLYVNHILKKTTWIDPRRKKLE